MQHEFNFVSCDVHCSLDHYKSTPLTFVLFSTDFLKIKLPAHFLRLLNQISDSLLVDFTLLFNMAVIVRDNPYNNPYNNDLYYDSGWQLSPAASVTVLCFLPVIALFFFAAGLLVGWRGMHNRKQPRANNNGGDNRRGINNGNPGDTGGDSYGIPLRDVEGDRVSQRQGQNGTAVPGATIVPLGNATPEGNHSAGAV